MTHTLTSTSSSSTNDTPPPSAHASRSGAISPIPGASIPLPDSRAASGSPAVVVRRRTREDTSVVEDEQRSISQSMQMQSMDMTDIQISPPQLDYDADGVNEAQYSQSETDEGQNQLTDTTDDKYEGFESQEDELNEATSAEEAEPTFSSEAEQTAYRHRVTFSEVARHSPASGAPSSPAQSLPFTPTPAFPRPRSRFNAHSATDDLETPRPPTNQYQHAHEENPEEQSNDAGHAVYDSQQEQVRIADDDLVTPHTRRRSFLLSVINSNARPQLKYSIPHPRNVMATEYSVSGANVTATPATNIRTAFAGFTPRPRLPSGSNAGSSGRTTSQPASVASQISPASQPSSGSATKFGSGRVQWATPGQGGSASPQDDAKITG